LVDLAGYLKYSAHFYFKFSKPKNETNCRSYVVEVDTQKWFFGADSNIWQEKSFSRMCENQGREDRV
jgi:hypothetical protein